MGQHILFWLKIQFFSFLHSWSPIWDQSGTLSNNQLAIFHSAQLQQLAAFDSQRFRLLARQYQKTDDPTPPHPTPQTHKKHDLLKIL